MIKFALNDKLQYMLRKFFSLLFFLILSTESNLFSQICGVSESVGIGSADGSFESCAPVTSGSNVTCGGWFNGLGTADAMEGGNNNMSLVASPDGGIFAALYARFGQAVNSEESFTLILQV